MKQENNIRYIVVTKDHKKFLQKPTHYGSFDYAIKAITTIEDEIIKYINNPKDKHCQYHYGFSFNSFRFENLFTGTVTNKITLPEVLEGNNICKDNLFYIYNLKKESNFKNKIIWYKRFLEKHIQFLYKNQDNLLYVIHKEHIDKKLGGGNIYLKSVATNFGKYIQIIKDNLAFLDNIEVLKINVTTSIDNFLFNENRYEVEVKIKETGTRAQICSLCGLVLKSVPFLQLLIHGIGSNFNLCPACLKRVSGKHTEELINKFGEVRMKALEAEQFIRKL